MKTKTTFFKIFLFLIVLSLSTACKKGEMGPAGPQGPQGIQGIAGADGNTILSGTGTPTSTTGKVGDYYLDISTSNLYGPKTSNGWGSAVNLKGANGATGANGTNGNGILSGNGAPSTSLGVNGDFYLDKVTYNLYGPKTAGSWGVATSLIGPAGPISYSELSFTDIKAQEARMSTANITATSSSNMWNNGNIILFKTNENRYGKFRIINIDITQNFKLSISATVYNTDGSLKFADKTIVIEGTNSGDLDLGVSSTFALGDFHWNRRDDTLTFLSPSNGAKFLQYK